MAINASGVATAIALQLPLSWKPEDGLGACLPLAILLNGVKWIGRKMQFSMDCVDIGAFMAATDNLDNVPPMETNWGYIHWWEVKTDPMLRTSQMPLWWDNPPLESVSHLQIFAYCTLIWDVRERLWPISPKIGRNGVRK